TAVPGVPSTTNVTVPVGVKNGSAAAGATVAVNVTAWPGRDGLAEVVRVVVLATGFTVWVTAGPAAAVKRTLPVYSAMTVWVPPARAKVVNVAVVPVSGTVAASAPSTRNR